MKYTASTEWECAHQLGEFNEISDFDLMGMCSSSELTTRSSDVGVRNLWDSLQILEPLAPATGEILKFIQAGGMLVLIPSKSKIQGCQLVLIMKMNENNLFVIKIKHVLQ